MPYVKDAKKLGLIKKAVADLYRDEKLNLVNAGAKVRALIDQYIQSQGIDPKVPPVDILSLDFRNHVQRHSLTRTQAAAMEFPAHYHIDTHIEEYPVYYEKRLFMPSPRRNYPDLPRQQWKLFDTSGTKSAASISGVT